MSEQRRALCVELAEVDRLIVDLQTMLISYKTNTNPEWGHVESMRYYKQRLMELLGRE